jgi:hypothetical protein
MRDGNDNHAIPGGDTLRRAKATGDAAAIEAAPIRRPHFTGGGDFRAALMRRYERRMGELRGQRAAESAAADAGEWRVLRDLSRRHRRLWLRANALWDAANPGWGAMKAAEGRAAA